MRTPSGTCLLCNGNKATKTNSHILPRFISTGFLGSKGKPRKGYLFNDKLYVGQKPLTTQDSSKENYILCDECESYFSIIEGASANTFKLWISKIRDGEFTENVIKPYLSIIECNSANPHIVRLLVYSMFWRASISSLITFENYNLSTKLEESLRSTLLQFKSLLLGDLVEKFDENKIPIHPFAIMTSRTFKDETANILAALNAGNPASLNVDKFGFILFHSVEDFKSGFMKEFSNVSFKDCKFMVLSENLWHELMVEKPLQMAAQQIRKNTKA